MNSSNDIKVGTVGKKWRVSVKDVFRRGNPVIFLERDGKVYMTSLPSIIGVAQVDDSDRITLPKDVRKKLGLKEGDLFAIEMSNNGSVTLELRNAIKKVRRVVLHVED